MGKCYKKLTFGFTAFIMCVILTVLTGCMDSQSDVKHTGNSAEKQAVNQKSGIAPIKDGQKAAVIYFSRADDNYGVGVIEKGNTEKVAEVIAQFTNAELIKLEPVKPYPFNYKECTDVAKEEKAQNARPDMKHIPDTVENYDVVFIGYPIWWGDLPMGMYTFLERVNLNGKIIVPFCTHEGSGDSDTGRIFKEKAPNAKEVKSVFSLKGSEAQAMEGSTRDKIALWAKAQVEK